VRQDPGFDPNRAYRHVYVSPHLDDAVLSCGGAIAAQVAPVLVLTLCTAPAPASDQGLPSWLDMAARREEDLAALAILGADPCWAGMLDAPLRIPSAYGGEGAVFAGPVPGDPMEASALELLDRLAPALPGCTLHAPLGVGGHADHLAASAAARRSRGWTRVLYYEDFPYVSIRPDALPQRLSTLPGTPVPVLQPIEATLERKTLAIEQYRSQIGMLFGSVGGMRDLVAGFARWMGRGIAVEREWTF
jgi:LmbE family N-acetylglucosaminyl deacetylase